ncbi:hypothetical protein [Haloarcula nitratireducens]|uniref:Copper ABC transporter permease n=1 Tax=Haloarcula nitratireducens TaxID=2487749 RepID=A0AAW4PH48_9EURY|nr:hypothetical protein [Halomicroarcula nitratireducens]MBX0296913.1 hypothetical protein [Halomicroarcula nitratireducens]
MTDSENRLLAVFEREFRTIIRSRTYGVIALGFVVAVLALSAIGGVSGYISVILGILTPLEALLVVLGAAFGYRALLADDLSGELDMVRSFPIPRVAYTGGVLLGRVTAIVSIVLASLFIVGVVVQLSPSGSTDYLLRRTAYNGALLFVRFSVLTTIAAVVFFTVITAVSAAVNRLQQAISMVVLVAVMLALGLDVAILTGLATNVLSPSSLPWLLALSPLSAYRGLVLALVIESASAATLQSGSVLANSIGLLGWAIGSLVVSVRLVW